MQSDELCGSGQMDTIAASLMYGKVLNGHYGHVLVALSSQPGCLPLGLTSENNRVANIKGFTHNHLEGILNAQQYPLLCCSSIFLSLVWYIH